MTYRDEQNQWAAQRPVTTKCLHCDWEFEGTCEDGRHAHEIHRRRKHGLTATHRRRYSSRTPWAQTTNLGDNVANARAEGAAGWVSDDPEWQAA